MKKHTVLSLAFTMICLTISIACASEPLVVTHTCPPSKIVTKAASNKFINFYYDGLGYSLKSSGAVSAKRPLYLDKAIIFHGKNKLVCEYMNSSDGDISGAKVVYDAGNDWKIVPLRYKQEKEFEVFHEEWDVGRIYDVCNRLDVNDNPLPDFPPTSDIDINRCPFTIYTRI